MGYACIAVAYTYPLIRHFFTHVPGQLTEFSYSIWNLWHFRYTVSTLGTNPFWTDQQYWPYGGNLFLVHYTPLNDLLAYPLIPVLGLEATSNLLFLSWLTLAGYGVYLLLRDWGYGAGESFVSGVLYQCAPFMTLFILKGRGQDYTGIHPLPFYVWALSRAIRDGKLRDVILASLCLTWLWTYSYYHFLFCGLLIPLFYVFFRKPVALTFERRPQTPWLSVLTKTLKVALVLVSLRLAYALSQGQIKFGGTGTMKDILVYVAPYLAFWGLLAAFLWARTRLRLGLNRAAFHWGSLAPFIGVSACYAALNWPLIAATLYFMGTGDYGAPTNRWRGGGDPMDLSFMLLPGHYAHPLWGDWFARMAPSFLYIGNDPAIGFIPLLGVLWLWRQRSKDAPDPWVSLWLSSAVFFFVLMLGPWLRIFGVNTYLPLPFYLLRLLPVFIQMTNGRYFAIMLSFFLALLFAAVLRRIKERSTPQLARWVPAIALLLISLEFAHSGPPLFRLDYPPILHRLRDRPYGAVYLVPVSALFHYMKAHGPVGKEFIIDKMGSQIIHQKPYAAGGKLGRMARRVYNAVSTDPVWQGLLDAQDGAPPTRHLKDRAVMSRYFRNHQVTYVLAHAEMIPPALAKVMKTWPIELIDEEGPLRLYLVRRSP